METAGLFDIIITHVAIQFVNGNAFFVGIVIIVFACVVKIFLSHPASQVLPRIGIATGAIIIGISATPLPIWFYLIWAVPALVVLVDWRNAPGDPPWCRHAPSILLIVISLTAALVELPYHLKPNISIDHANQIIVIGDSISAGIGNEKDLWPTILQRELDIAVANLSVPGAKVADMAEKAVSLEKNDGDNSAIILEIGGNDILGKTEIDIFERYLDRIFDRASDRSDTIIVLELPLPPFCNGYGMVQRRLVRKYKARLIPKRYFAGIIGRKGATVDGLHLSPSGHRMFADMILDMLETSEDEAETGETHS